MTQIYFIRHSISDLSIKDNLTRPLTKEGIVKANELVGLFENIHIDYIFSSPYKRAIQTIEPISKLKNIEINIIENFREGKICDKWIDNYNEFIKKHWESFLYKLDNCESLLEIQERNIKSLEKIIKENIGKTIIIGTHGTGLSTIINYYDKTFLYNEFIKIIDIMPYIIKFEFEKREFIRMEEIKQ